MDSLDSCKSPTTLVVCRLCLDVSYKSLYSVKYLKFVLFSVLPNLDLTLSKDPGICINCVDILTQAYNFKTRCITNQDKILNYYNTLKEPVDLYDLVNNTNFSKKKLDTNIKIPLKTLTESIENDNGIEFLNLVISKNELTELNVNGRKFASDKDSLTKSNLEHYDPSNDNDIIEIASSDIASYSEDDTDMEFVEEERDNIKMTNDLNIKDAEGVFETAKEGLIISTDELLDVKEVTLNYTQEFETEEQKIDYSCDSQSFQPSEEKKKLYPDEYDTFNLLKAHQQEPEKSKHSCNPLTKINPKHFTCQLCYKTFSQKVQLDSHLLNKHKDIPKIEASVESKIHYCSYCRYRTINTYNLTSHMMSKHGQSRKTTHTLKTFYCVYCCYSTYNKGNLVLHLRTHNTFKAFNCKKCKMSFKQKSALDGHCISKHHGKETSETSELKQKNKKFRIMR